MSVKLLLVPVIAVFAYLFLKPADLSKESESIAPTFLTKSINNPNWTNISHVVQGEEIIDIDYFNEKLYLTSFNHTYVTSLDDPSNENIKQVHEYKDPTIRKFIPTEIGVYMVNEYGRLYYYDSMLKTWSRAFESFTNKTEIFDLQINTEKAIVVGAMNGAYKSIDGGKIWEKTIENDFIYRINKEKNDLVAYGSKTIYKSTDFGSSWKPIFNNKNEVVQDFDITQTAWTAVVNRPQMVLPGASGPLNLYYQDFIVSYDQGQNWVNISKNIPYKGNIKSFEAIGTDWYISTDSGVFESNDDGKTWTKVIGEVKDKTYRLNKKGNRLFAHLVFQEGC